MIYNEEVKRKLIDNNLFIRRDLDIEYTATKVSFHISGSELIKADFKFVVGKKKAQPALKTLYIYQVNIYSSYEDYYIDIGMPGKLAAEYINRYVMAEHEEYVEKTTRTGHDWVADIYFTDDYNYNTEYKDRYWGELDINSAEPFIVSKLMPELEPKILELYASRKDNPVNKVTLVALNGTLRNTHISYYHKTNNILYDRMCDAMTILRSYGFKPFALRRDSIIFEIPKHMGKTPAMPKEFTISPNIGDWKITYDQGNIMTGANELNFYSDMNNILSRITGTEKYRPLQAVYVDKWGKLSISEKK